MQADDFSHTDAVPARAPLPRAQAPGRGRARRSRCAVGRRRLGRGRARRSSRPASRPSRTRRRPPSSAARSASSPAPTASRRASRSWPTASARTHGVTRTLEELRERGVPGFEVEVIGTDGHVDRRLPSVSEVDMPVYAGDAASACRACRASSRRSPTAATTSCTCARPGPAGIAAALTARLLGLPIVGSLPHRARRLRRAALGRRARSSCASQLALGGVLRRLRRRPLAVGSVDDAARRARDRADGSARWDRGVDVARFSPALRDRALRPGAHQRPLRRPADAREGRRPARRRVPRGHARATRGCTSCSPAAGPRRRRCASASATRATFLGWLDGDALARAYASPTCSCSARRPTPTGRCCSRRRRPGCRSSPSPRAARPSCRARPHGLLCPPRPGALGPTLAGLAGSPAARAAAHRRRAAAPSRERTWEACARPARGGLAARAGARGHATAAGGEHHGRRVRRGGTSRAEGSLPLARRV